MAFADDKTEGVTPDNPNLCFFCPRPLEGLYLKYKCNDGEIYAHDDCALSLNNEIQRDLLAFRLGVWGKC